MQERREVVVVKVPQEGISRALLEHAKRRCWGPGVPVMVASSVQWRKCRRRRRRRRRVVRSVIVLRRWMERRAGRRWRERRGQVGERDVARVPETPDRVVEHRAVCRGTRRRSCKGLRVKREE